MLRLSAVLSLLRLLARVRQLGLLAKLRILILLAVMILLSRTTSSAQPCKTKAVLRLLGRIVSSAESKITNTAEAVENVNI